MGIGALYVQDAENPGAVHGNGGGQGRAGHIHAEACYKHQVQDDVYQTGHKEKQQGGPAVPQSPENAGIHVVAHISQAAPEDNAYVSIGKIPGIGRHLHKSQDSGANGRSEKGQRNSAYV